VIFPVFRKMGKGVGNRMDIFHLKRLRSASFAQWSVLPLTELPPSATAPKSNRNSIVQQQQNKCDRWLFKESASMIPLEVKK
jgi:hypothetical protein